MSAFVLHLSSWNSAASGPPGALPESQKGWGGGQRLKFNIRWRPPEAVSTPSIIGWGLRASVEGFAVRVKIRLRKQFRA